MVFSESRLILSGKHLVCTYVKPYLDKIGTAKFVIHEQAHKLQAALPTLRLAAGGATLP